MSHLLFDADDTRTLVEIGDADAAARIAEPEAFVRSPPAAGARPCRDRAAAAAQPPNAEALTRAGRASFEQATEAGHGQAIRSFEAALAADPGYAPAQAGMSDAYVRLYLHVRPDPQYLAGARKHAARAVELAPASSQALAARAQIPGSPGLRGDADVAGAGGQEPRPGLARGRGRPALGAAAGHGVPP